MQSKGKMIGDKTEGEWKYWDADGNLLTIGNYNKGKWNGTWTDYNKSKKPNSQRIYEDEKKTGTWKYWDENGLVIKEETYNKDNLIKTKNFQTDEKK